MHPGTGDIGRSIVWTASVCVALLGMSVVGAEDTGIQAGPSTARLVRAAGDYVTAYQNEFKFLVADETSEQRVIDSDRNDDPLQGRVTRGELFLTYLSTERQWTIVHDVAEVDGVPVADREDLSTLLQTDGIASVARRLFDWNARYNIGRVIRNFNDPMLAMLPLTAERRSRFSFSTKAIDRSLPGIVLVTLGFRERERPTLVRDVGGRSVFSQGEIVVDASTGVVRRTSMTLEHDGINAVLSTDYTRDERLGLWVPSVFHERYTSTKERRLEITTCESRYSNYRRFEATIRMR